MPPASICLASACRRPSAASTRGPGTSPLAAIAQVHATCPPSSPTVQRTTFTQWHIASERVESNRVARAVSHCTRMSSKMQVPTS